MPPKKRALNSPGKRPQPVFGPAKRLVPFQSPRDCKKTEVIEFASASLFFKAFEIHGAVYSEKDVLVDTVVSRLLTYY